MGQSTDALLFYGFEIDEHAAPWGTHDWEDWVAQKLGLLHDDEDYYAKKRAAFAAMRCTIETHCYSDYPMYAVVIKDTKRCANRGYPQKLKPEDLAIDPQWNEQLRMFANALGLEYKTPSWLLASYWG